MAKNKNNVVIKGMSGKFADMLVFSQRFGQTIVGKVPLRSGTSTASQLAVREKFSQATIYAVSAISDPATKKDYEAMAIPGQSAYNLAIADFFNAPEIESTDTAGYSGNIGGLIKVKAKDDFRVAKVTVIISKANGTIVEQGDAVSMNGVDWVYTATIANSAYSGNKVKVQVRDLPGNLTEAESTLA